MFYFDEVIREFEDTYSWDKALIYLEDLFHAHPNLDIVNSLLGFSWYYLIVGPIDSKRYENDENGIALDVWKRYLNIGFTRYQQEPSFCFIAGYTLLLHGFYIDEYEKSYKKIGVTLINKACLAGNPNLRKIAFCVSEQQRQKHFSPINIDKEILNNIFCGDSLLEKYFREVFFNRP